MESHLSRQYTLAELEPGWPEDVGTKRVKSSPRMQGSMRMAIRRVSRTPENSRVYAPGDPVHLIDWKAFGRTDELVVREHRDEASSRVLVIFDRSSTLCWPKKSDTETHGGIDRAFEKIDIAIRLALYLAHAHLTMGDSVTVAAIDGMGGVTQAWSPKSPADVLRVHETCVRQGFFAGIASFLSDSTMEDVRFDVGWLITDFLAEDFVKGFSEKSWNRSGSKQELSRQISSILPARSMRILHVFSWLELSSAWMDGATSYRDESPQLKFYMGDQLKSDTAWVDEMRAWQVNVESGVKAIGASYLAVDDRTKVADFFHWLGKEAAASWGL